MAHSSQLESFGPLSVSRRGRRVVEGGLIPEERFLQLQSEVYRLRREANAREEEHKLLLSRLSRAEDAAKRNIRDCFQQSLEPSKMKTNIIAAVNHTFYADQRVRELDDKLRDKQREIDKLNEFNKQCKADITSLKTRLDMMSRHARRTTHVVTPCDFRSASSGHTEKGAKKLRRELQKLQTENLNLQFQISNLSQHSQSKEVESRSLQSRQDISCQAENGDLEEHVLKQSIPSAQEASAQMIETWQQLENLQSLYDNSMTELQSLTVNDEKLLGKLREARLELNEERKKSMRLEVLVKHLSQEVNVAQQTQILLQQACQQNLQLEREKAELISSALRSPLRSRPNKVEEKAIVQQLLLQESQA